MTALRIKPTLVVLLEQSVDESLRRLQNRRIDPSTGVCYNLEVNPPTSELINSRLVLQKQDEEANVRRRYATWNQQV